MTISFEPNGVECNAVDCDGILSQNTTLYPTFFVSPVFFNQIALVGGVMPGGEGPIIFYVPADPPEFEVPAAQGSFFIPQPKGTY